MPDDELLALDEALDRLAKVDTRSRRNGEALFFCRVTQEQAGKELAFPLRLRNGCGICSRLAVSGVARNLKPTS